MPIIPVECPKCHKHYNVDEKAMGQVARCVCGHKFPITIQTNLLIEESAPSVKDCPFCAQPMDVSAAVCQICGYDFLSKRAPKHRAKSRTPARVGQKRAQAPKIRSIVAAVLLVIIIVAALTLTITDDDVTLDGLGILGGLVGVLFVVGIVLLFALVPGIIAFKRKAKNRVPILWLSLLFGFTVVGWVAAFIWAFVDETDS